MHQGVVNQAMVDSFPDSVAMLLAERCWKLQFKEKVIPAGRLFELVGGNPNPRVLLGQFVFRPILRGAEPCTRTERRQGQLRRRQPLIESTIFGRWVAGNRVLPRFACRLNTAEMFNENFYCTLLPKSPQSFALRRCVRSSLASRGASATFTRASFC
jgi:hypothetical protein